MEKQRKIKMLSIIALVIAVLGVTIAFAALSGTLRINGSGTMDRADWNIYFDNLSSASTKGKGSVIGTPILEEHGAEISNIKVKLKQPQDSVTYTVDIVNNGDIDAEIDNIVLPTIPNEYKDILDFEVVYTDNEEEPKKGDVLTHTSPNNTRNLTIKISYKDITDESLLPSDPEAISLDYSILYGQLFEETTTTTTSGGVAPKTVVKQIDIANGENDSVTAYFYDDDTILIDGEGDITSDLSESLVFEGETPYNATSIVLAEGITNVPSGIYTGNEEIEEVNLPSTITKIEDNAFTGCTGLTEIEIPSSVTEIGDEAFKNCTNLEEITIGSASVQGVSLRNMTNSNTSNITSIGQDAFYNCTSLTNIDNIISGLTSISANMLYNCTSLSSLTIPTSVVSLGATAFSGCTGLTSLSIPGTLDLSGDYFTNVTNLEEVTITGSGAMVNYTSSNYVNTPWFLSSENMITVVISQGITSVGAHTFRNCINLTSVTIPNSVTSVGNYAFNSCTNLTSVTIQNGVETIGNNSFQDCTSLSSIIIPSSVTSIGKAAFSGCTGITSITIPNSVSDAGARAFYGWAASQTINIDNTSSYVSSNWTSTWKTNCNAVVNYLRD